MGSMLLMGTGKHGAVAPSFDEYFILDTDIGKDPDDAAAFGILCDWLIDHPTHTLLAAVAPQSQDYEGPCLKAFMDTYATAHANLSFLADVPVGVNHLNDALPSYAFTTEKVLTVSDRAWRFIAETFGKAGMTRDDLPSAVSVLRAALESAPNASVTYIKLGPFANLHALMISVVGGVTGAQLLAQKVKKVVGLLGDADTGEGTYNNNVNPDSARYVINNWKDDVNIPWVTPDKSEIQITTCGPDPAWSSHIHPIAAAFERRPLHVVLEGGERTCTDSCVIMAALDPGNAIFTGFRWQNGTIIMGSGLSPTVTFTPGTPGPFSVIQAATNAAALRTELNSRIQAVPDPVPTGVFHPIALSPKAFFYGPEATFSGSNLTAWANEQGWDSGAAQPATPVVGPPTLGTAINGLQTVRFDADGERLVFGLNGLGNAQEPGRGNFFTFFWAGNVNSIVDASMGLINLRYGAATGAVSIEIHGSAGTGVSRMRHDGTANPPLFLAPNISGTGLHTRMVQFGTTNACYEDGVLLTLTSNTTGVAEHYAAATDWVLGLTNSVIGGSPSFVNPALSDFLSAMIFDYQLTADDRQRLEGYWHWAMGDQASLSGGHPYKNAAPTGWY